VASKLEVTKGDLLFEAAFPKPDFALFRDTATLLDRLYLRLEPYGLKLTDIRIERGAGNIGDQHVLLYLFSYWMTVRVRVDRIEVNCSDLPQDLVEKFKAAIIDVLRAVADCKPNVQFRTFALIIGLHGKLEGQQAREYLARFAADAPKNLGPATGSGAVFYFGVEDARLFATITTDLSAVVQDGLFVRIHGAWDASRVAADAFADIGDAFVRRALDSLGLQLPVWRSC
jgi:hypothetical protein